MRDRVNRSGGEDVRGGFVMASPIGGPKRKPKISKEVLRAQAEAAVAEFRQRPAPAKTDQVPPWEGESEFD